MGMSELARRSLRHRVMTSVVVDAGRHVARGKLPIEALLKRLGSEPEEAHPRELLEFLCQQLDEQLACFARVEDELGRIYAAWAAANGLAPGDQPVTESPDEGGAGGTA